MDAVRAQAIRTLFVQIRTSVASGFIVATYMVATALPYTRWPVVAAWAVAMGATQLARAWLRRGWVKAAPADDRLPVWVRRYTWLMALAGALWGATIILFAHPGEPITVALTLCGLFGMCGGAVAGQAYNPPGLNALIWLTFGTVLVRLCATGEGGYTVLGITCGTFALAMTSFGRVQARTLDEGFRIRFENQALVEALTAQKAEAEDARRKAELASLAKSQFLAAASHDLRQPLYALSLFSSSLGTLSLDEEGRQVVGNIQGSVAAMESLFTGLLDISKLEAGVIRPTLAPVSVDALFDRLSQYSRPIAVDKGLDLRFRSDGEWVLSDETLLEQVLANLVANAVRHTAKGGVLVAARGRGDAVRLEVWDTGPGIAGEDQARIFDEFVQLANPERDRRKGLGLGLSIARRAAALIGGMIELSSRPGLGSRFAIVQPRAMEEVRGDPPLAVGRLRIDRDPDLPVLLVEDDRDVRAALCDLLGRWGVTFEAVADGEAALARVEAGARYGLILSDYRLSGVMDGLELIGAIQARLGECAPAAALVTGEPDPDLIGRAHAGDIPVLLKPVATEELRMLLRDENQIGTKSLTASRSIGT